MRLEIQQNIYERLLLDKSQGNVSFEAENKDGGKEIPVGTDTCIVSEDTQSKRGFPGEKQTKQNEPHDPKPQLTNETDGVSLEADADKSGSHGGSTYQSHIQSESQQLPLIKKVAQ